MEPGRYTVSNECVYGEDREAMYGPDRVTRTFCLENPILVGGGCRPVPIDLLFRLRLDAEIFPPSLRLLAAQVAATPPETEAGVCPEGVWTLDLEATDYVRVPGVTASGSIVLAVGHDGLWSTSGSLHLEGGGAPPSDVSGDGSGPWTRGAPDVVTFTGNLAGDAGGDFTHRVLR